MSLVSLGLPMFHEKLIVVGVVVWLLVTVALLLYGLGMLTATMALYGYVYVSELASKLFWAYLAKAVVALIIGLVSAILLIWYLAKH